MQPDLVPQDQPGITPVGYQGAAQHTWTAVCDGFHEPGPCPPVPGQDVFVHAGLPAAG